jgi:protein-S-isoprenylcysteine O-methyltransferase Ste14
VRRWLVPATFLALACSIGAQAEGALLALLQHPGARHALLALYALLRTAVAFAFAAFTVNRAEPRRNSRELPAIAACVLAMGAVVVIAAPPRGTPEGLLVAGDGAAVLGCVWLLVSVLALGRCFGVLPEARGFVLRGPYRLVRHPVYLGEIVALAGLGIAAPVTWNLAVVGLFVVAQLVRTHFEENALSEAFPEYRSYAARTGRLFPRVSGFRKPAVTRTALTPRAAK